jgi:acetolactate synthase-1/2/3 large subunit
LAGPADCRKCRSRRLGRRREDSRHERQWLWFRCADGRVRRYYSERRIAAIGGTDLLCDTFFARMERGGSLPSPTKLPYFSDRALELTRRYERVIVAGTRRPVAFFGDPGLPSYLTTEEQTVILTGPQDDTLGALATLASEVNAPDVIDRVPSAPLAMPKGDLDAQSVSAVIARLQPVDCIVMDEVLTVGVPYFDASKHSPRFSHRMLTGGAIGQGPSAARPSPVPTAK